MTEISKQQPKPRGPGKPFKKVQSGNPGGRPKEIGHVRELARQYTEEAIETQVEIMRDKKAPAASRVVASENILNRGYGKPNQPIDGDGDGGPLTVIIRKMIDGNSDPA